MAKKKILAQKTCEECGKIMTKLMVNDNEIWQCKTCKSTFEKRLDERTREYEYQNFSEYECEVFTIKQKVSENNDKFKKKTKKGKGTNKRY